jgi:hypothetical protein
MTLLFYKEKRDGGFVALRSRRFMAPACIEHSVRTEERHPRPVMPPFSHSARSMI